MDRVKKVCGSVHSVHHQAVSPELVSCHREDLWFKLARHAKIALCWSVPVDYRLMHRNFPIILWERRKEGTCGRTDQDSLGESEVFLSAVTVS